MAAVADSALRRNVACPFCGLACDDLTVAVDGGPRQRARSRLRAQPRGFRARAARRRRRALPDRRRALDEAVAARRRHPARQPAAAVRRSRHRRRGPARGDAARRAHGRHRRSSRRDGLFRNLRVVQDSGWMTTTLSEVRNRADLLLIVGPDPTPQFPRFFERCVAPRQTLFAESRQPPPVVRLGRGASGRRYRRAATRLRPRSPAGGDRRAALPRQWPVRGRCGDRRPGHAGS